jgi:hypothetical protein
LKLREALRAMNRVSLESLKDYACYLRDKYPERADVEFISLGIAICYLHAVVGVEWTAQMGFPQYPVVSRSNRPGRVFMKTDEESIDHRYRYQDRTSLLAELLFNLQSVEGIDGRLDDLRAGKLEATYAELEAGSFLLSRGIPFKYIDERGVRGFDYDAQILLRSGAHISCEMKCKVESTELSDGAIRNAFNTARKQLPSSGLGLVFLKIPESWLHVPTAGTLLSAVINDFLRGTSRVIAVVVRWEEVYLLARETAAAIISKYRVELGTPPKSFSP